MAELLLPTRDPPRPADTEKDSLRQYLGLLCPPYLCGCVLTVAAGLKGLDAVTNPLASGPVFGSRWELLAVMEAEFLLGLALLLQVYPAAVRLLAMGCFSVFAGVNLSLSLGAASSCGYLVSIPFQPASTLLLYLGALAILGLLEACSATHSTLQQGTPCK